jgi:hypothetical protein
MKIRGPAPNIWEFALLFKWYLPIKEGVHYVDPGPVIKGSSNFYPLKHISLWQIFHMAVANCPVIELISSSKIMILQ